MGCGKASSLSKLLLIRISHGPAVTYATQAATAGSAEPMACTARLPRGTRGSPAGRTAGAGRSRAEPSPNPAPMKFGPYGVPGFTKTRGIAYGDAQDFILTWAKEIHLHHDPICPARVT